MYGLVFDKEQLASLLDDIGNVSECVISFASGNNEYIGSHLEISRFCHTIGASEEGRKRCYECDACSVKRAEELGACHLYECHAGLTEILIPVKVHNNLTGFFAAGQFLSTPPSPRHFCEVVKRLEGVDADFGQLEKHYYELKYFSPVKVRSLVQLLERLARSMQVFDYIQVKRPSTVDRIIRYIDLHYTGNASVTDMSRELGISKYHLSRLIKSELGAPFTELVLRKRMAKAKQMLVESDETAGAIAVQLGFGDPGSFYKVFKKLNGYTPKEYRSSHGCRD